MQDENTKRSGARLTSLFTVFAVLVCMLSLLVFPASAASEPTAEQFYGVWTMRSDCCNNLPSASFDLSGVHFLLDGKVNDYLQYNGQYQAFQSNTWASTTMNGNEVFDFGQTPVEIPEVLFDFFVENFDYSPSSYSSITETGGQVRNTDDIFGVFSGVGEWLVGAFNVLVGLFYSPASGLTFLGVLAVCGLGLSVIFLLMGVIQRFLSFRG